MTKNQWRLLEILTQFGEYSPNTDAEDDISGWRKIRLVVAGLIRTLVKRGLATNDENGYNITEIGKAELQKDVKIIKLTGRELQDARKQFTPDV